MSPFEYDLKWALLTIVAVSFAMVLLAIVVVHSTHQEAMAHIAAGHVQDQHGNWIKP